MHYNVFDFRAIVKHAYYGADDSQKLKCEATGRSFPHWENGAAGVLTRYINPLIEEGESPRNMIAVHDMGREFRTGVYPDYKAQASKQPENKSPIETEQVDKIFDWAKRMFSAIGATQIGVNGVEADDVIAWIVQQVEAAGGSVTVYTVDFDLVQLASDKTNVVVKGVSHIGDEGVFDGDVDNDLLGLPYRLTSFAKSLLGDKSDNYGGVSGVGKVALRKLQEEFGDDGLAELQTVVSSGDTTMLDDCIEATGNKTLIKIRAQFAEWRMGWKLAQLRPELCWKPRKKKLVAPVYHKRVPNPGRMFRVLEEAGCADMWEGPADLISLFPAPFAVTADNWHELRDDILAAVRASDLVAFDYETSDKARIPQFRQAASNGDRFVDALSQELAGASFQFGRHLEDVIYVPVDHYGAANLPKEVVLEILEAIKGRKVAHNAFFEGVVTKVNLGVWLTNVEDTRIMKRMFDENTEAGLKYMSSEYLGYEQTSYEATIASAQQYEADTGEKATMMCQLSLPEVFDYAADDSLVTGHLSDLMQLKLILDGQWHQYCGWGIRPTEVVQRSYVQGVRMNWALQKRKHRSDLHTIEQGMQALREVLRTNVTGNITSGCESLIEAEKSYIYRKALKKYESSDEAKARVGEWRKKLEAACQYTPYREEMVMPSFAFTAKQISAAALKVGLPELEKLNYKAWDDYLKQVGAVGFEDEWTLTPEQIELVKVISTGMSRGCLSITNIRAALEKAEDQDDAEKADLTRSRLEEAEGWMPRMAEVVQRLAGVEARSVPFGDPLNVGSPQQMQHLLYCKIGVPVRLRGKAAGKSRLAIGITEAGPATDEKAVETAIANDIEPGSWQAEALAHLLKVKSATTRCSLYHDKYPLWRHKDGLVHPYITLLGTDTMRPTASAMNVLQVSKKDKVMRSMFIPPTRDHVCVAIDFNGQEIRIMANLAQDEVMMSVYDPANEKDLHSMTGAGIGKMSYEDFRTALGDSGHELNKLTKFLRQQAKGVNFGMAYGAGPGTLSRNLIVPVDVAKDLLDKTFALYSRIQPWQRESAAFMSANGYTLTAFGTKRHASPDVFHNDKGKVSRQHRQGTNAQIQQTAADMLGIVLTDVAASGMLDRYDMVFFAPIYDEVVAWVHKDDVYDYCHEMGGYMAASTPPGHRIPQVPEFSIGADWGRVHELGRDISRENVDKFLAKCLEESVDIWEKDVLEPFDPISKYVVIEIDEDEEQEVDYEPTFD